MPLFHVCQVRAEPFIFLSNKVSSTLIIPIDMARKFGLDKPSHVILEETDEGILIKKLEI